MTGVTVAPRRHLAPRAGKRRNSEGRSAVAARLARRPQPHPHSGSDVRPLFPGHADGTGREADRARRTTDDDGPRGADGTTARVGPTRRRTAERRHGGSGYRSARVVRGG